MGIFAAVATPHAGIFRQQRVVFAFWLTRGVQHRTLRATVYYIYHAVGDGKTNPGGHPLSRLTLRVSRPAHTHHTHATHTTPRTHTHTHTRTPHAHPTTPPASSLPTTYSADKHYVGCDWIVVLVTSPHYRLFNYRLRYGAGAWRLRHTIGSPADTLRPYRTHYLALYTAFTCHGQRDTPSRTRGHGDIATAPH